MIEEQKDIKTGERIPEYVEIDVQGLAQVLAEESWKKSTESVSSDDLYEPVISAIPGTKDGKLDKQVRGYWTHIYFSIYENYKKLILSFKK